MIYQGIYDKSLMDKMDRPYRFQARNIAMQKNEVISIMIVNGMWLPPCNQKQKQINVTEIRVNANSANGGTIRSKDRANKLAFLFNIPLKKSFGAEIIIVLKCPCSHLSRWLFIPREERGK